MLKEAQQPVPEGFKDTRQPAMLGWNTITDAHDLKPNESPNILNMYFDAGVIGPRPGCTLFAAQPTTETGDPLQCFIGKTSDGVQYLISSYFRSATDIRFYLWDTVNKRWTPILGSYAPTFTQATVFGYQGWDNGYGDDRLYFGNGKDRAGRWKMAAGYLSADSAIGSTTLTSTDFSRFIRPTYALAPGLITPSTVIPGDDLPISGGVSYPLGQMVYYVGTGISGLTTNTIYYAVPKDGSNSGKVKLATTMANAVAGTVIPLTGSTPAGNNYLYIAEPVTIYDGTTSVDAIYYQATQTTLTLTSGITTAVSNGSIVTGTITDRPGINKGKIFSRWQSRLIEANGSPGTEHVMGYSRIGEPEDFITAQSDITSGGTQAFNDGYGEITDIKDFGEFLVIGKNDVEYRFGFIQNSDLSAQISQIVPIISGESMGPISVQSSIKALNTIYYPTETNGFVALSPISTGVSSSTGVQIISFNINNFIQNNLSFTPSVGEYFNNKLIWTCEAQNSQNFMIVYDTIRQAWTRFDSWNPKDMFRMNNKFYFMSAIDGGIYQGFTGYTDNDNPYNAYFTTKLDNGGVPAMPKKTDAIYIEGYMTQSSTFYVDALYNEKGDLLDATYKCAISTENFIFSPIRITTLGQLPINQGILDSLLPSQINSIGYFRCYLSLPNASAYYAMQLKFYSKDPNSIWYITGYSMNPQVSSVIPPLMRVDPISLDNQTGASALLQEDQDFILT